MGKGIKKYHHIIDECWECEQFNVGRDDYHCILSDKVMDYPEKIPDWCKLPTAENELVVDASPDATKDLPLSCQSFEREDQNALYSALSTAANRDGYQGEHTDEYAFLESTPRASLVFKIIEALSLHGFQITKGKKQ